MVQSSVTLVRCDNRKHDSNKPANDLNSQHIYVVRKTKNTLAVQIREVLNPSRVRDLIASGVDVTIEESSTRGRT